MNNLIDDYKLNIFTKIKYKLVRKTRMNKTINIRNFGTLNKFRKGAKITKIKPAKLLIKNLG